MIRILVQFRVGTVGCICSRQQVNMVLIDDQFPIFISFNSLLICFASRELVNKNYIFLFKFDLHTQTQQHLLFISSIYQILQCKPQICCIMYPSRPPFCYFEPRPQLHLQAAAQANRPIIYQSKALHLPGYAHSQTFQDQNGGLSLEFK